MRFIDRIIRILLILMVLTSIVLSLQTWLDGSLGFPIIQNKDVTTKVTSKNQMLRKKNLLFLPTQLYLHQEQSVKMASQESNLKQIVKELKKQTYSLTEPTTKGSKEDLLQQQNTTNSLELVYLTPFSLKDFFNLYKLKVTGIKPSNFKFNHLMINTANGELTFFNTFNNKMCILSASNHFSELYQKLITKNKDRLELVKENDDSFNYILKDDTTLPKYRYTMTATSYTVFTKAFFTTPGELTSKDNMDNLAFSDNSDNTLHLNNNDGMITFNGKLKDNEVNYLNALKCIQNLGNDYGDLRYFMSENNQLIFHDYLEGYPIFGDHNHGSIEVDLEDKHFKLSLNQEVAQVPLPLTDKVQVLSTKHVDEKLQEKEIDLNKIQDRLIGYKWQADGKNNVYFEPMWYLLYENNWYSLDDLLNKGAK